MTNEQLYLAIGVPLVVNILFNGAMFLSLNKRLDDLRADIDHRFSEMQKYIDARFDTARAQLLRVEQVMDARLKHLEER